MTPSQAKNAIRRALAGVVDPHPSATQIHKIWAYFGNECAYCGKPLERGDRDGHIDHLVSTGAGGSNALGNCVLACSVCNGDEKRDEHWEAFLRRKAADPVLFAARLKRIQDWVASNDTKPVNPPLTLAALEEADKLCAAFDAALHRVRQLKSGA